MSGNGSKGHEGTARSGFPGRRRASAVGVDLDESGVRIVELAGHRLKHWVVVPFPPGVIQRGVIRDPVAIGAILRRAADGAGLARRAVHTAVSGAACVVRRLSLPAPSAVDLRHVVRWEAERIIPYPFQESVVDYDVLAGPQDGAFERADVILVGARADVVQGYADAIRAGGLRPAGIDVVPMARARACRSAVTPPGVLLLGTSRDSVEVTGVDVRGVVFTRNLPLKLDDAAGDFAREIHRSTRYFEMQTGGRPTGIVITGEPGAVDWIRRELATPQDLPIVEADPLQGIERDSLAQVPGSLLAVAIGLARRGLPTESQAPA